MMKGQIRSEFDSTFLLPTFGTDGLDSAFIPDVLTSMTRTLKLTTLYLGVLPTSLAALPSGGGY
jgi:hypothetical protein